MKLKRLSLLAVLSCALLLTACNDQNSSVTSTGETPVSSNSTSQDTVESVDSVEKPDSSPSEDVNSSSSESSDSSSSSEEPDVALKYIELSENKHSLKVGGTFQLTVNFYPTTTTH